jgi:hypothetical protein
MSIYLRKLDPGQPCWDYFPDHPDAPLVLKELAPRDHLRVAVDPGLAGDVRAYLKTIGFKDGGESLIRTPVAFEDYLGERVAI